MYRNWSQVRRDPRSKVAICISVPTTAMFTCGYPQWPLYVDSGRRSAKVEFQIFNCKSVANDGAVLRTGTAKFLGVWGDVAPPDRV